MNPVQRCTSFIFCTFQAAFYLCLSVLYKSYFNTSLNGFSGTEMKQDSEIDLEQKNEILLHFKIICFCFI